MAKVACIHTCDLSNDIGLPKTRSIRQLRRAAVSIAANIAEGFKRRGKGDKARFMNISQASLEECRYYLIRPEISGTRIQNVPCVSWRKPAGSWNLTLAAF